MYFHSDLEELAIKLMGKVKYDEMVFARTKREANAKARYEKELIDKKERAREAILAEERRAKEQKEMVQGMEIAAAKAAVAMLPLNWRNAPRQPRKPPPSTQA